MQVSAFAARVQAQLAASRALLAQAPAPLFAHDGCAQCQFVGTEQGADLYVCTAGSGSAMARYSSEPSDYSSGPLDNGRPSLNPLLNLAASRAQRGNGSAPLLLVLFLACALGTGIGYGVMHVGGQLADAIAQAQARR